MDFLSILIAHNTVLAAVLLFVLGFWTYFERRNSPKNQAFAGLLIASALWLFTYVLWNAAVDRGQALFWLRTLFFIASFLPVFFLLFVLAFFGRFPGAAVQTLFFVPSVALYVIAFHTPFLASPTGVDATFVLGYGALVYAWHFALMLTAALVAVLYEARIDPAIDRRAVAALAAGAIVAFNSVFALLYASRLGEGTQAWSWPTTLAVTALAAGMLLMAFTVDEKKFLADLRPVGAELFILVVIFLVAMDIVLSQTPIHLAIRIVIMMLLVMYGVFATRTATRELQRLRQISALHDQLVKMNGRLIEADKLKTKFVCFASHQLRAPIGGVRCYLDMMKKGDFGRVEERQDEVLGTVIGAVERLNETIETFLDISKIELGTLELFKTETNIAALIAQVVKELRPLADQKRLTITTDFPTDLPNVLCDSGKLFHAIMNLAHNAIKYTASGGVTISAVREGKRMAVRIADSGIGMGPKDKNRVMALIGGDLATVRFDETGGSGLGLYIVKNIVSAHFGDMIVESAGKGSGSTFGFRIPIE